MKNKYNRIAFASCKAFIYEISVSPFDSASNMKPVKLGKNGW